MDSQFKIEPEHLIIVKNILGKYFNDGFRIYVFGSRASAKAKTYSDLDIAIENIIGKKIARKLLIELEYEFEESDLPWKVDLIDLYNINPNFKKIIEDSRVEIKI